jgi:stage II sporulation protein M
VVGPSFRRALPAMGLMLFVAVVSVWMSYDWIMTNVSQAIANASPEDISKLQDNIGDLPDLSSLRGHLSAPFLFFNNTRSMAVIFLAGMVSFSVLGVLFYMINVALIGGVYAVLQLIGISPMPIFLAGVLPHGLFELPALLIGSAVVLYIGAALVTPQNGRSMGEVIIELMADWAKIFVGLVVPLLAIAALIEAYITPNILLRVMGN